MSFFGKLTYKLFYAPRNKRVTIQNYGGQTAYNDMLKGEKSMRLFAFHELKIDKPFDAHGKYKLNFLTGEKFLHQSLFCVYSFFRFLTNEEASEYSVRFYDDNTLSLQSLRLLEQKFSNIEVTRYGESMTRLKLKLPPKKYPYINKKAKELFFFNKIFFLHTHGSGLQIYLDSDMLFLKKPVDLLEWLKKNYADSNHAFGLEDIKRCYGYSDEIVAKLGERPVDHQLNAGFYGIHSSKIDFDKLEFQIKNLEEKHGPNYFMEQCLTSLLLTEQRHLLVLPKSEYIVFPDQEVIESAKGTMHHYVDISKYGYFTKSWKLVVEDIFFE